MSAARRIEWTAERIGAFWEYWSARADAHDEYFTYQVGGGVVAMLGEAVTLRDARVLDFGCGPGFLIPHLLETGALVWAADGSASAVAQANARFAREKGWRGAREISGGRTGMAEGSFDVVCCVETIEHVPEEDLPSMIGDIARLLAPGGHALFTTPNDEDLARSMVFCPACNTEFHKVQHLSSWTAPKLAARIGAPGLDVRFCGALDYQRFVKPSGMSFLNSSVADLGRRARLMGARIADRFLPRPFPEGRAFRLRAEPGPHLAALAVKRKV